MNESKKVKGKSQELTIMVVTMKIIITTCLESTLFKSGVSYFPD